MIKRSSLLSEDMSEPVTIEILESYSGNDGDSRAVKTYPEPALSPRFENHNIVTNFSGEEFPVTPRSVDEVVQASFIRNKIRRKMTELPAKRTHLRIGTSRSEPGPRHGHDSRRNTIGNLRETFPLRHFTPESTIRMMKRLRPAKIPMIERFIRWGKGRWPGHPGLKWILHSPYFFLYIISLSLVQALAAAFVSVDTFLIGEWNLAATINYGFFVLYLLEIYIKGFEFFLQIYNIAEVTLTLTAFILDFKLVGTAFVATVLSLRIIWCIHKVPGMAFVYEGTKIAAPRISVIIFPLLILIYVFSVIATSTLGPPSYEYPSDSYWLPEYNYTFSNGTTIVVPGADLPYNYFGNIALSMLTLFQVMTGDAWMDQVTRPTMRTRPWSFILFVLFYSLFSFVLLNIFTAIMVNAVQTFEEECRQKEKLTKKQKKLSKSDTHSGKVGSTEPASDVTSVASQPDTPNTLSRAESVVEVAHSGGDNKASISKPGHEHGDSVEKNRSLTAPNDFSSLQTLNQASGEELLQEMRRMRDDIVLVQTKLMNKLALLEAKLDASR